MKKIISFIPNLLTLCNLTCGLFAIIFAFGGNFTLSFYMIIIAAVFDFMDGFAARLLNARSEIGLQLDSLSDVVSFGVAPALVTMLSVSAHFYALEYSYIAYLCLLLAPFAAYRLAVFNVDTTQSEEFKGLPTPAMALLMASLSAFIIPLIPTTLIWLSSVAILSLAISILMVSRIPMFSFKFKNFSLKKNLVRYCFAIASVITVVICGVEIGVGVIIFLYICTSIVLSLLQKGQKAEN